MRDILLVLVALLLCLPVAAQEDQIDCVAAHNTPAVVSLCGLLGRIDDTAILRRFSIAEGSRETYSVKEFAQDLVEGISAERRFYANDDVEAGEFGFVHLSFATQAICGTQAGNVVECIGSIPQWNNGASCRHEHVSGPEFQHKVFGFVICEAVVGWGTGFYEQGEIYLLFDQGLKYVGYFPTYEHGNDPVRGVAYQLRTTDRLGASADGSSVMLDRCVAIEAREAILTLCEKYNISSTGAVGSVQGRSSFNSRLSEAYSDLIWGQSDTAP